VSFSSEDECEINCFSRRATISSLHSLIRRRNSVRHSSKFDIVDGDHNTALIPTDAARLCGLQRRSTNMKRICNSRSEFIDDIRTLLKI
jgi:hypothetical protein